MMRTKKNIFIVALFSALVSSEPATAIAGTENPVQFAQVSLNLDKETLFELNSKAVKIRDQILEDPRYVTDKVLDAFIEPTPPKTSALYRDAIGRLVRTSVPLIGCTDAEVSTVAFYNVIQDIWLFVSVDKNSQVLNAKLSAGLELEKLNPKSSAWFEKIPIGPAKTLQSALEESFRQQIDIVTVALSGENCKAPDKFNLLMDSGEAFKNLSTNATAFTKMNPTDIDTLSQMTNILYTDAGETKTHIKSNSLTLADIMIDVLGYDILTFHTWDRDPSLILLQGWKKKDDKLKPNYVDYIYLRNRE